MGLLLCSMHVTWPTSTRGNSEKEKNFSSTRAPLCPLSVQYLVGKAMTKLSLRKELDPEEGCSQLLVLQGGDHGDNVEGISIL